MKIIRDSAEHHFLTSLDRLKTAAKGWMALYFPFSRDLSHKELLKSPRDIADKIAKAYLKSDAFLEQAVKNLDDFDQGFAYLFPDNDVLFLVHTERAQDKTRLHNIYTNLAKDLPQGFAETGSLAGEFYNYQKLADQKLLTTKRRASYEVMADTNKVSSIPVRRSRRDDPCIVLVEDDRFTASYTANILSKDYDLVVCRNGEEGIEAYIEHAPDIVFLDIHLPGLSGHETLQAIRAIDPDAFIVMLSVDTAKTNIVQATQGGVNNFLKKPFSRDRLLNVVKTSPFIKKRMIAGTD